MRNVRIPATPYTKANQFPGLDSGKTMEQIRKWTKNQKKLKGFNFNVVSGTAVENLSLPGEARFLLGFKCRTDAAPTDVDFTILLNNEQIIETANLNIINMLPAGSNNQQEYLPIGRMLSGQDTLTINFRNGDGVSYNVALIAFYL